LERFLDIVRVLLLQVNYRHFSDRPEESVSESDVSGRGRDRDEEETFGRGFKAFLPTADTNGADSQEGVCTYRGEPRFSKTKLRSGQRCQVFLCSTYQKGKKITFTLNM
jgi:hypothetical protein